MQLYTIQCLGHAFSKALDATSTKSADAVLISTKEGDIKWYVIIENAQLLVEGMLWQKILWSDL